MTRHSWLIAVLLAACRIGGPDGDFAPLDVDSGAPMDAASPMDAQVLDASSSADARVADASLRDAAPPVSCAAPPDLACDPVRGEGCLPLMQCLGDPSKLEANCVLGGIQLGAMCSQDDFSTNCPSQHTCVMGACRKYCYCDSDCGDAGKCAAAPADAGAFRLCAGP